MYNDLHVLVLFLVNDLWNITKFASDVLQVFWSVLRMHVMLDATQDIVTLITCASPHTLGTFGLLPVLPLLLCLCGHNMFI